VDNSGNILGLGGGGEEEDQYCLDTRFCNLPFFCWGELALSFRFLTDFTTPTFITPHNSLPHVMILVNKLDETASTFNPILSLFSR
jgi:hypothetical protein